MLYPKNEQPELSNRLFENPTEEYRAAPFWAWNCQLDKKKMEQQIQFLKVMGFGGFFMHSRTGMATPYLSEEFFEFVRFCVQTAEKENMRAWAYDEDRWPSGSAGGLVTRDIALRGRKLVISSVPMEDVVSQEQARTTGQPYLFASYDVVLDEEGDLVSAQEAEQATQGKLWYAYVLTNASDPWYNGQAYVDTLSKQAMDRFIELTYEGYHKAVGEYFGTTVPAMFTDEPQFNMRTFLPFSHSQDSAQLPWTEKLPDFYYQHSGAILKRDIPYLFWQTRDERCGAARYRFTDAVSELFCRCFMDNCGKWCQEHGLLMTGHMMLEPTLELQSWAIGDVMRAYRSFTLPGMDILCERMEFSTAKQVQSTVHQYAREGMSSELYGVMNWDYDFRGHKFQGDWQAALGVTLRVPHLSWMSMEGEAKRDYPASFNYQSPWYDQYHLIEDHYARLATALTRGSPVVKVAVIHPCETYWLHAGPKDLTGDATRFLDEQFENVIEWLLDHHIDFDFISEALLPELCDHGSMPLCVGAMEYDAVVVPGCQTLRKTTLTRLNGFCDAGGDLIFMGKCPTLVDGVPSEQVKRLYDKSICIDYDRTQLLQALNQHRVLSIRNSDGLSAENLMYALRQDGQDRWLFIAHSKKRWEHNPVQKIVPIQPDVVKAQQIRLTIRGIWYPVVYDTMTGKQHSIPVQHENGHSMIGYTLYDSDSLLLRLCRLCPILSAPASLPDQVVGCTDVRTKVSYTLQEENVLLLDRAEFALDGGAWEEEEELLRLDNRLRQRLGWPLRQKKIAQPWAVPEEKPQHWVKLRFTIESQIAAGQVFLAMEQPKKAQLVWNGQMIQPQSVGWFTDEAIEKIPLPDLRKGSNTLEVTVPYLERGSLEWMYLLGEFGTQVLGASTCLTAIPKCVGFGDLTRQGFAFYGGNISYHVPVTVPECAAVRIRATHYRGMFIKVFVDGEEVGDIIFAPYSLTVPINSGEHTVSFRLYGNRHNSFGALHNADDSTYYYGPDAWRTQGDSWCYEYRLKDFGILKGPVFEFLK